MEDFEDEDITDAEDTTEFHQDNSNTEEELENIDFNETEKGMQKNLIWSN